MDIGIFYWFFCVVGEHTAGSGDDEGSGDEDYDVHNVEMLKYTPRGTLPYQGNQAVAGHRLPGADHFSENPIYGTLPSENKFYFNLVN